jgi:hypothetical protein
VKMVDIKEKKERRFKMQKKIYDITGGDEDKFVEMWKIGEELGFDRATTEQTTQYLAAEGLIAFLGLGGIIGITHYGIKQMEQALEHPDQPSRYFPPVNIINIGSMSNSQIQQGAIQSTQVQSVNVESVAGVKEFIDKLKFELETLPIGDSQKEEIRADIMMVEVQLKKGTPNKNILSESLKSIRTILEGISSNMAAQGLIVLFTRMFFNT